MKPVNLSDLNPQGSSFTLSSTGKTYRLRPVNLADERWLAETFGSDLEEIFKEMKMLPIARIVFHQLEEDSKQDFRQIDVKIINEEGVEITKKMGGAELLFWQIRGMNEKIEIIQAMLETIGISRKMLDDFEQDISDEEKKSQASRPTGQQSLTDSPASMDGQQNTSGPAL